MTLPIPSALPADVAERRNDATHLYKHTPRTRLVIDLEAHERAVDERNAIIAEQARLIEKLIAELKEENDGR